jgi:hypothetical protein
LAVEALILYGGNYNGDKFPDGGRRIEFDGKIYTKNSFA